MKVRNNKQPGFLGNYKMGPAKVETNQDKEISELRAQLAAEIEKREKAEGDCEELAAGKTILRNKIVGLREQLKTERIHGECMKAEDQNLYDIINDLEGEGHKADIEARINSDKLLACEHCLEIAGDRANRAEQALQKSEEEKVELERVCPHCKFFSCRSNGMICQQMRSDHSLEWPKNLKACKYWAKSKAIIERGSK